MTKSTTWLAALTLGAATLAACGAASAKDYMGVACKSPPPAHCNGEACSPLLGDVTEAIVKLMVAAPGGKLQHASGD